MRGETFARRLMLSVDAVGYGSRDDRRQRATQTAIPAVLDLAARQAGLDREKWDIQPGGDGELAILPAAQSDAEPVLVEDFVRELRTALAFHNEDLRDEARLRLRLAIHNGVAKPADYGYAGQGVVAVSRLVDCAAAKTAMRAAPSMNLSVILSERVFLDVVAQGHVSLTPRQFRRIVVRNKEFEQTAYLHMPDGDVHSLALPDTSEEPDDHAGPTPAPSGRGPAAEGGAPGTPAAHTTFNGPVNASGAVIGIQWNS